MADRLQRAADVNIPTECVDLYLATLSRFDASSSAIFFVTMSQEPANHIRYRSTGWSGRVEQVSQHAQHVCGRLAVRHLIEGGRYLPEGSGQFAAGLRIEARESVKQRHRRRLRVRHRSLKVSIRA